MFYMLFFVSALLCVQIVTRFVDARMNLPFRGMSLQAWEEKYGGVDVPNRVLLKRGLFVLIGSLLANTVLGGAAALLYAVGLLSGDALRVTLLFIVLVTFFAMPVAELLFVYDRQGIWSPIVSGVVMALIITAITWDRFSGDVPKLVLRGMFYFGLGWVLQWYRQQERIRP